MDTSPQNVANVHGPWWSFARANSEARLQRDSAARVVAEAVLAGDFDAAEVVARSYAQRQARVERNCARFDRTRETDVQWIGYTGHEWTAL